MSLESLGFSQLIWDIESELQMEYWPGAIKWADENHNNAWSNALETFDKALSEAQITKDMGHLKRMADLYKKTILILLSWYKKAKAVNDTESFLDALEKKGGK